VDITETVVAYVKEIGFPIFIAMVLLLRFDKKLDKVCNSIAVLTLAVLKGDQNAIKSVERMAGHNIYGERNGYYKKNNNKKGCFR